MFYLSTFLTHKSIVSIQNCADDKCKETTIFQYLIKIEDIFPYCPDCPNSPKLQIHFGNLAFHLSLYVSWDKSQKEKRTHKWRLVHFQITALARARCENGAITCIKSTIYKKRCFMFYGCSSSQHKKIYKLSPVNNLKIFMAQFMTS